MTLLVKKRISDFLLSESALRAKAPDLFDLLNQTFDSEADASGALDHLKENSKKYKKLLGSDDYLDIKDELKEIKSDLKWAKSKKGKHILYADQFAEEVYRQLRQQSEYDDVYIGAHASKNRILVTGKVENEDSLAALQRLVESHESKYKIEFQVIVDAASSR